MLPSPQKTLVCFWPNQDYDTLKAIPKLLNLRCMADRFLVLMWEVLFKISFTKELIQTFNSGSSAMLIPTDCRIPRH